ncbi:MAG: hypothetical protein IPK28_22665 [Devosia sp.]|nr:hypothetical protein [Devosia sp.]
MQGVAQLVSAPIEQVRRRIRGHRVLIAASLAVIIAAATAYAGAAPGEILPVVFAFSAVVVAGTMMSLSACPPT